VYYQPIWRHLTTRALVTRHAQLELDRASEEFRQIHAARHSLIGQLDDLLTLMRKRDEEIHALAQVSMHFHRSIFACPWRE